MAVEVEVLEDDGNAATASSVAGVEVAMLGDVADDDISIEMEAEVEVEAEAEAEVEVEVEVVTSTAFTGMGVVREAILAILADRRRARLGGLDRVSSSTLTSAILTAPAPATPAATPVAVASVLVHVVPAVDSVV